MPSTGTPASARRDDRARQARGAQPLEVGQRALRPRNHDRGRRFELGGAADEARVRAERGELVQVRDPGQRRRSAMRPSPASGLWSATPSSSGSGTSSHGTTPSVGTPVRSSSHSGPGASSDGVAAEAVEQEAREQVALGLGEAVPRAEQVCERPAAVDVAAQQDGRADLERDRHVDDVAVAQVDLGRTARALDHDDVVVVHQPVQRRANDRPERRAALAPGQTRDLVIGLAQHDHLRARVGLGLDEHRVHARLGRDARGGGLHDLRAPELAPVGRDAGVVAHVLRLERRHAQALVGEQPAERCRQIRLARVRRAALHHQRLTHRRPPGRGAMSAAPGSRASALNE